MPGIKVGHWTDERGVTGCTVILCPEGAVAGGEVRGSAPGTRETDLLRPGHLVQKVHAVLLSGGSAFGLDAASGVVRYLEERGYGFDTGVARVPIVPTAIIFDLGIGDPKARPGPEAGYRACLEAGERVAEGSVGAGTGATIGKILGVQKATKGGLGTASRKHGDLIVAALMVVNAFGDVIDPNRGRIIAGPRNDKGFLSTVELMKQAFPPPEARQNTTIGVIATNAMLDKEQANKLAQFASHGMARVIHPFATMFDGDAVFALATGQVESDINFVGALAVEVVMEAILRAVYQAKGLAGIPGTSEISGGR